MQTKERLRLEVADWIKRCQHEAKLAFAEGDLWSALAWGTKVPDLLEVERDRRAVAYETGVPIDCLYDRVARIVRALDWRGRIKQMFGRRVNEITIGIDMAMPGGSSTAIASLFARELDRMGRETMRYVDSVMVETADSVQLDCIAPNLNDEEVAKRCRETIRERMSGKSVDLIILDDPLKR